MAILLGSLAFTGANTAQPAGADEPTIEWVRTGSDSVVEAGAFEAMQAAEAEAQGDAEATNGGPFGAVNLGEGFNVFSLRSYGDYTIHLVDSSPYNIEDYRSLVQNMANQVNAPYGLSLQVAAGTLPTPANPSQPNVPNGEIWVMMTASSPCGALMGSSLGCGGVRGLSVIEGEARFSAGAVWLNPTMPSTCQQPVVSHEIGHALGLNHFDDLYLGQKQIMASSTNCSSPLSLQAGDLNGIRWLAEPTPSNDSVAIAATICLGDSAVSASTWFATKEPGEATHAGAPARRSVWYRFAPRAEQNGGTATISTINDGVDDFDTVLEVYRGATPSTSVTSDNDGGPGNLSLLSFVIDSSQTYWVAVDGVGGVGAGRGETDVVFDLPSLTTSMVPLCAPARLLDTRFGGQTVDGLHQATGQVSANATYQLQVAGRAGIPPNAASVVLNVTAVAPSGGGFVTVFPCGQSVPNASNLNFVAGDVIPNSVLAKVGAAGSVCLFSSATTDILVDVSGYFPNAAAFSSLSAPARLLDTRVGGQTIDGAHAGVGRLAANVPYELPVTNRAGVPLGSSSVVLNVTAIQASVGGFLTVYPCGTAVPNASNLNFVAGDVIPNLVLAKVGADGKVCLFSSAAIDLLADVSGYFMDTTYLVPLSAPARVLDSRVPSSPTVDGQHQATGRIAAGSTYELLVAGRAGVPGGARSVVLNVTAVLPSAGGFITVYPCGAAVPNASNLNFSVGEVIPNAVLAGVGTGGKVCFFSSSETDLLVDVSGYFL